MAIRSTTPVDKHLGARVRMRRMMIGVTQEVLAAALDLTFQQVQKYEKGSNRIGGGRLQQIATALKVPVSYFFEGAPGGTKPIEVTDDFTTGFLADRQGLALARAFMGIASADMRTAIVAMAEAAAAKAAAKKIAA